MDEATIADLKQFIATIVRQEVQGAFVEFEKKMNRKFDDLSASIADTIDIINDDNDKRFKGHGRRIKRLEQWVAAH